MWSISENELDKASMELGLGRYSNMDGKPRLSPADLKDMVMDVFYHPSKYVEVIRDYTSIIEQPETEALYPADIRLALANVQDFVNRFVEDKWKQIQENELREVRGKLLKPKKVEEGISASLKKIIENHKDEIIEKFIEELTAIRGNIGRSTN